MRLPSATAVAISSPSALSRPLDTSSRILPLFTRALEGASGLYPGPLRALGLVPQPSAQRLQVGNQGRDLVVGEAQVGHDRSRLLLLGVGEPQPQVVRVHVQRVAGERLAGVDVSEVGPGDADCRGDAADGVARGAGPPAGELAGVVAALDEAIGTLGGEGDGGG